MCVFSLALQKLDNVWPGVVRKVVSDTLGELQNMDEYMAHCLDTF